MLLGDKLNTDNQILPKISFTKKMALWAVKKINKVFGLRRHGFFIIRHIRDGRVLSEQVVPNLIVNAGLPVVAGLIGNVDSQTAFGYIAVGTDNTAAAAAQTGLIAEITDSGLSRAAATITRVTTTVANDTTQFYKEFSVTGTKTVVEAGIFNAASSGTMLARAVVTSTALVNGDKLQITYKIPVADDGA